jgi:uncharacterized Zn ribbon protein
MVLKGIMNQCKKCGSVNTYASQTHIVCRKCGHKMIKPHSQSERKGINKLKGEKQK